MEKAKPYKAILYSRVSTTHDDQTESIENQILLARNYLEKHPDIELAEPLDKYSERQSGKSDIRPKFQELCERLTWGDIRYLMIKDLKRLARSVETTYAFLNIMKQYGFEIIQLDSGNIIDSSAFEEVESNLLIGIEALFAQNTVLTQSRYGKTVQRVRCENKRLARKDSTLFGYKWDPEAKDIVIDDGKADIIRELYNRYVFRDQGIQELKAYLSSVGYYYSIVSISKWLRESKYIGDWTINRKGSVLGIGQGAKTRRFYREESEWVHIPRPDLAIVDKEIYDLAQDIRLSRVRTYSGPDGREKTLGAFRGTHLFAGKVVCSECGSAYRFKWANRECTVGVYYDSYKSRTRIQTQDCPNTLFRRVYEEDLKEIVVNGINALNIKGSVSISKMIDAISFAIRSNPGEKQRKESDAQTLKRLEQEANRITHAFPDATPSMRNRLNSQLEEIEKQIAECKEQISKRNGLSVDETTLRERLSVIEEQLSRWVNVSAKNLSRKMVDKLISNIIVHPDGRIEVIFTLGGILNYQLPTPGGKRKTPRKPPHISFPIEETIHENVRHMYREVTCGEKNKPLKGILSFDHSTREGKIASIEVGLDTKS